jgi:hypothetical protein
MVGQELRMHEFNALAAAIGADLDGVRASLILSRDGLVIGAHPAAEEDLAKQAWRKLASLGDPDRGFFQFVTETWCYVRRGPYAAFVLASAAVRPGLVIDEMERVLLIAARKRADRSSLESDAPAAASPSAPSGKPRTTLHRETAKADDDPIVIHTDVPVAAPAVASDGAAEAAPEVAPEVAPDGGSPEKTDGKPGRPSIWANEDENEADDREGFTSLASEFSRLLQDGETSADG